MKITRKAGIIGGISIAGVLIAGIAFASSGPGADTDGTFKACVRASDHAMFAKVSPACPSGYTTSVVTTSGLVGPAGPAGAPGAKGDTGAAGTPGVAGAAGTNGKDGKDGANAQALPYGIALVNVSRGGAAATTWATYSTTLGSPVGDTASGTFRMACSAAKAPCVISVQAYATTSGVTVYPRLDISAQDTNNKPIGNCEYADGTDNNNSASPELSHVSTSPSDIKLGIGGTLDCGSAQTYPTDGIATRIDVPAGFYDIAATFTFKK